DPFNAAAEKDTQAVQTAIEELDAKIAELSAANPGDTESQVKMHQTKISRLGEVKRKVALLIEMAQKSARARVAKLNEDLPVDVQTQLVRNETIKRLSGYQKLKELQANQAVDWQMIWLIPAIFAGVVMIFFALVFKETTTDPKESETTKDGGENPDKDPEKPVASDKGSSWSS
ncbi:MAG: hypothetical protein IH991_15070, partial [Planctomycetes bacterium]|nr:hypothetical protein [Planctomycetota bacterium]